MIGKRPNQIQTTAALLPGATISADAQPASLPYSKPVIAMFSVMMNFYGINAFVSFASIWWLFHDDYPSHVYCGVIFLVAVVLLIVLEAIRRGIGAVYEQECGHPAWKDLVTMFRVNCGLQVLFALACVTERIWR